MKQCAGRGCLAKPKYLLVSGEYYEDTTVTKVDVCPAHAVARVEQLKPIGAPWALYENSGEYRVVFL